MTKRRWTAHEVMRARRMRKTGHSYASIDIALDRRLGSTQQKLLAEQNTKPGPMKQMRVVGSFRAPPEVLAERDARSAANDLRDTTATFCGDPPKGYSALERGR